jgi:hypothetical protein
VLDKEVEKVVLFFLKVRWARNLTGSLWRAESLLMAEQSQGEIARSLLNLRVRMGGLMLGEDAQPGEEDFR